MNPVINHAGNIQLKEKIKSIDWEFSNADTQYLTHNIHRYSGKFIPQIARAVIEIITKENDVVLDPYMGSGTTILEAMLLNRVSIGIDINPLAVLISKVKTTIVDNKLLENLQNDLYSFVDLITDEQISIFNVANSESTIPDATKSSRYESVWNKKWYQNHVLEQLIMIYDKIEQVEDDSCKKIAQVAFSDILRKSSNANSRYPNVMCDKNAKERSLPGKAFQESLLNVINRVNMLSHVDNIEKTNRSIIYGNNTNINIKDESIDAIVTHPPYIAAIPYAEYGCLSLNWLGYDSKELDSKLTGGKRQGKMVVERFKSDYFDMLRESFRVLKRGKYMFLMVGNPTVRGKIIELDKMTVNICEEIGLNLVHIETRKGQNRRGNKMGDEFLIFLQKP